MLDATTPGAEYDDARIEAQREEAFAGPVMTPANCFETPAVAAAAGMMSPFAVAAEMAMGWRKARALGMRWSERLAQCKTPQEVIDVNAQFGEKALSLGHAEMWRVVERSALWGRSAVAPSSFALRDTDD